ncbi:hypothetical protein CXK92_15565 [Stutzerimonas stutzeri]|uniref:Uncharacterized protein n=1 Tax=Stutzerimonas stutzeri TaxID=316 RepID=A0A2N8S096_STUST|nr:hypothetical protein CXK92_15565 [Stutzerimonas stutzeri]
MLPSDVRIKIYTIQSIDRIIDFTLMYCAALASQCPASQAALLPLTRSPFAVDKEGLNALSHDEAFALFRELRLGSERRRGLPMLRCRRQALFHYDSAAMALPRLPHTFAIKSRDDLRLP